MFANTQETVDLVTFTEEILNGKLLFFCTVLKMRKKPALYWKTLLILGETLTRKIKQINNGFQGIPPENTF